MNLDYNTFHALSEPNRFHIVELLQSGPRPVNEISSLLKLAQPKTSKHLKILADAGVVEVAPLAQKRYYKINTKTIHGIEDWANKMGKIWDTRFDKLDKLLAKEEK